VTTPHRRRLYRARRTAVVMTLLLVASFAVVTAAALRGHGAAGAVVCPGAAGLGPPPTVAAAAVVVPGGLPGALAASPDRLRLVPVFHRWASVCGVPAALVEATCYWESGWQDDLVSPTGAVGVCQIEPAAAATVRTLLDDTSLDPRAPSDNIEMSAAYLRWLLDGTGDRQDLALAGYYQGLSSVHHHGILAVSRPYVAGVSALLDDYRWP